MSQAQISVVAVLLATMVLFLWGRWRHDMVAMGALLACVALGVVPAEGAFAGFAHPAVITVACVLVLSQALYTSGAIDVLTRRLLPTQAGPTLSIAALTGLAALLSGFMNNVGALALMMPVALQMAERQKMPPGRFLMPLAFGSILGGMTTLVGTPPNLIVSGFRAGAGMEPFRMFDFTPVGLSVAAAGVLFVALIGWRLVPARERAGAEGFEIGAYLTELRVSEDSASAGSTLREVEGVLEDAGAQVLAVVRNGVRMTAPHFNLIMRPGDVLVIETEADALTEVLSPLGLRLEESKRPPPPPEKEGKEGKEQAEGKERRNAKASGKVQARAEAAVADDKAKDDEETDGNGKDTKKDEPREEGRGAKPEIVLAELAVRPEADIVGYSARSFDVRTRYGINIIAVSRQGQRSTARLARMGLRAGDVLLVQGPPDAIAEFSAESGCVPLAQRTLRLPNRRKAIRSSVIMALAIAAASLGLVPAAVAFAAGVLASMALGTVSLRGVYTAVDWPVVVLLAALIPVAGALEATGAAGLLAGLLLEGLAQGHAVVALVLVLVVTMTLSDLMNNAATAAVMCPVAIGVAGQLGASPDAFLMAVAVGASCAFLTPIGHQNNTLVLGPGGFRFGDYWRLGLPLELLVIAVSVPALLMFWPL